jgi:hypothetical protein
LPKHPPFNHHPTLLHPTTNPLQWPKATIVHYPPSNSVRPYACCASTVGVQRSPNTPLPQPPTLRSSPRVQDNTSPASNSVPGSAMYLLCNYTARNSADDPNSDAGSRGWQWGGTRVHRYTGRYTCMYTSYRLSVKHSYAA